VIHSAKKAIFAEEIEQTMTRLGGYDPRLIGNIEERKRADRVGFWRVVGKQSALGERIAGTGKEIDERSFSGLRLLRRSRRMRHGTPRDRRVAIEGMAFWAEGRAQDDMIAALCASGAAVLSRARRQMGKAAIRAVAALRIGWRYFAMTTTYKHDIPQSGATTARLNSDALTATVISYRISNQSFICQQKVR
jgi:hypothetical protein